MSKSADKLLGRIEELEEIIETVPLFGDEHSKILREWEALNKEYEKILHQPLDGCETEG